MIDPREFKRVDDFLTVFKGQAVMIAKRQVANAATHLAAEVRKAIKTQSLRHSPLSATYLRAKQRAGLDPRILMATGEYVGSIQAVKQSDGAWKVGLPNRLHGPSGLPLNVLAAVHEFGSRRRRIPARPHWRPVWKAFLDRGARDQAKQVFITLKKTGRT